jgi:23S rRNA (guanine745-N1)-methyltransferase
LSELAAACADESALEIAGTDISKAAVQAAARRGDTICWAVANNRHLPFVPGSIDLVVSMFGFAVWEGFKPVQAPGGRVLLVDPGPDHLLELREVIYPAVKRGEPPTLGPAMAAGYRLEDSSRLRFQAEVSSRALLQDLVAMTPHASRMPLAGREALGRLERLTVTFDVAFRMLRLAEQPMAAETDVAAVETAPPDAESLSE